MAPYFSVSRAWRSNIANCPLAGKVPPDDSSFHRLSFCCRKLEILVNPQVPGYAPDSMVGD